MKQSLQIKLGQRLTLTPQLQQSIRLLALSGAELQAEIRQALEQNPLLEERDSGAEPATEAPLPAERESSVATDEANATSTEAPEGEDLPQSADEAFDLPYASGFAGDEDDTDRFALSSAPVGLREHLIGQLGAGTLSDDDRQIAMALVDSINPDGYLGATFDDVRASLGPEPPPEDDEIEAVLHQIQNFDPTGVGARDLRECLLLQLRALPDATPGLDLARQVVSGELERLGRHDFAGLCRLLGVDETELDRAVRLIQSLRPRPGALFGPDEAQYVVPDVLVRKFRGRWVAELNPQVYPPLFINTAYRRLASRAEDNRDGRFVRERLQEARWFLKSLRQRNDTIMRVARAIVERQTGFLEHGEAALKPLVMRDISGALELHESTVSRAVAGKYALTPRGVFELKRFFSNALPGEDGSGVSSAAIRGAIRALVAAESPGRPLGDGEITDRLGAQGMKVARRTVAKYREQLRIPPAARRRGPA